MNKKIFAAGGFGGILPSVFTLSINLIKAGAEIPQWSYWIGILILFILGGLVAYFWDEPNPKKAIFLGIGLPSLIQINVGNLYHEAEAMYPPSKNKYAWISSAYAQETDIPGRKLEINSAWTGAPLMIVFLSPEGDHKESISPKTKDKIIVAVPSGASSYYIKIGSSRSDVQSLPKEENSTGRIDVTTTEKAYSGLLNAFGAQNTSRYEIAIQPSKR